MPFHCFDQGDAELIIVQAQTDRTIQAKDLFPDVDPRELEDEFSRIPRFFGESADELRFTQNISLVRLNGKTILVDTGIPTDQSEGLLLSGLAEANVGVDEIDLVVITHRDMDHVGGTVTDGKPTYPNARYVIGTTEYEGYKADPVRNHFPTYIAPLEEAGVLDVVADDALVMPGVQFIMTSGHRPGAVSVLVQDRILLTADVWHSASQVSHPDWQIKFDSDPVRAVETRRSILNLAEQNGYVVCVPHTPFFGVGTIVRERDRQVWKSLA